MSAEVGGMAAGASGRGPLWEVAILFLKLGTIAFGGPAAHIALMRDEVVVRRRWLSDQHFLDLLGATNLIPGPNPRRWRSTLATTALAGGASLSVGPASSFLPW